MDRVFYLSRVKPLFFTKPTFIIMKWLLIPVLFAALSLQAQTTTNTLPKIRYQEGFLSTKWELGDKDVKQPDIKLHLQKTNNDAFYQWRRADALEIQTVIWTVLATGGLVGGLLLKNDNAKLYSLGGAIGFGVIGLATGLTAGAKRKKAVNIYNKAAGY